MAVLLVGSGTPALAQVRVGVRAEDVGINAAIGLATATAWSLLRGRGLTGGVWRGLAGGAAMGVGRQIAASKFSGSGFAGREVSATGISLIASTGREHTTLSFPVGPIELQLVDGRRFDWRVNVTETVIVLIESGHEHTRLDASLSLSSGTFVFRDSRATIHTSNGEATGSESFGSIKLAADAFSENSGTPDVLFHENVHVLQSDYLSDAIATPIERAILGRTHIGRSITRHLDIGLLSLPINGIGNSVVRYRSRPWEREAYALTSTRDH